MFEKEKIEIKDFIFVGILLMGAAQFKLSFLLSGSIIGVFLFLKSFMNNKIQVIFFSIFLFIIFFVPTSIWNYNQLDNFIFQNIFTTMPMKPSKAYKV